MTPVPDTLEELLDPAWLSDALGVKVTSAELGHVVSRVSTNACFTITVDGPVPDGLSTNLCAKGYFGESGRPSRSAGYPEAMFYRDLAGSAGVRTLRPVWAGVDEQNRNGVVITEDIAAQGAHFLDALAPVTATESAEVLEQYARLHAGHWGDASLTKSPWLEPRLAATLMARGVTEISGNFDGPIGAGVPNSLKDPERLVAAVRRLPELTAAAAGWTLLHGDAHVGNVFIDGEGAACLIDWQLVQRGPWSVDVGYHLGCSLPVDERRQHEDELLSGYLAALNEHGVEAPGVADAKRGCALGLVYGFFLWAITLKVDPAITTQMLTRLGNAVADSGALDAVLSF